LFVNGAKEFKEGKNQNTLTDDNVAALAKGFNDYTDQDRFSRVVELSEIAENDYNLNIPRYVPDLDEEEEIDVATELVKLNDLRAERDEAESVMLTHLKELGYGG
jgi:type I restriction enzyme M protein